MHNYTGFIYIWFDTSARMYYIGSHFGPTTDGYTGSGIRFKRAFVSRPNCFRRRIIEYVNGDKSAILQREQAWLDLIKDEELNVRYYNQKKSANGGSVKGRKSPHSEETKAKMRKPKNDVSNYCKPKSEDHRSKLAAILSSVNKGADHSGQNNGMFEKHHNDDTKKKMAEIARLRPKFPCEHCGKVLLQSHLTRYHGTKCPSLN
jgi:hypothetical protein